MAGKGGQLGNQNAAKGKRFASALETRIAELNAMPAIVEALITEAMTGNMAAIKEIGDRLDGKPKQQLDIGGQDGENPLVTAINIRFVKSSEPSQDGN